MQFSCEITHYEKKLISFFQEFFASINKIFILAGRLDTTRFFISNTFINKASLTLAKNQTKAK